MPFTAKLVPSPFSASERSKGMRWRPLVAMSCKGAWGAPEMFGEADAGGGWEGEAEEDSDFIHPFSPFSIPSPRDSTFISIRAL